MRKFNWPLVGFMVALITAVAFAANDIVNYKVGGVSKFKITSAGNTTIAGTLSVTGATTFTGIPALPVRTIAQINALAAATNSVIACSDCTRSYVCKSSGTAVGAWTVTVETGTMATPTHCS